MPTIIRQDGYRLYFYSHEPNEPPHVHIDKGDSSAKIWLHQLTVSRNRGFRGKDLAELLKIVRENRESLLNSWHGYFGTQSG